MHFGSQTWVEACASPAPPNDLAAVLCNVSRDEFFVDVPQAASIGSTSLFKYDFVPGYACLKPADRSADTVLSRAAAPNRLFTCDSVENGAAAPSDDYTCDFACDSGFVKQGAECVSECEGLPTSCPVGFKHSQTCVSAGILHYHCEECPTEAGKETVPWTASTLANTCHYAACAAGTYSAGHACQPCAVNTISAAPEATECTPCDTETSGFGGCVLNLGWILADESGAELVTCDAAT